MDHPHIISKIGNLNLLYLNICSIRNKLLELEVLIKKFKEIDVVVLTEVWIYENEIYTYNIPDFRVVFN